MRGSSSSSSGQTALQWLLARGTWLPPRSTGSRPRPTKCCAPHRTDRLYSAGCGAPGKKDVNYDTDGLNVIMMKSLAQNDTQLRVTLNQMQNDP